MAKCSQNNLGIEHIDNLSELRTKTQLSLNRGINKLNFKL